MVNWRNLYYRIVKQPHKIAAVLFVVLLAGVYVASVDRVTFYQKYHEEIQFFKKLSNVVYLPYSFFPSKLDRYDIIISEKKWRELDKNLPPIYQNQLLTEQYKDTKSAIFRASGVDYDVNVRYRGDTDAHWRDPQKSWFIDFKKEAYFDNKEEIHLVIPVDRKYLVDELNFYRARKAGLVVPETKFVNLFVNGRRQGVYWMLEGASKDLLERQNIPGDVNFYASDDFTHIIAPNSNPFGSLGYWRRYSSELHSSTDNYGDLAKLFDLINNADDQTFGSSISDILDVDVFYQWQINQYLATSQHQSGQNMRFFFDTSRGKFILMPWDIGIDPAPPALYEANYNKLVTRILSNPEFLNERNKRLWAYVGNPANLEDDLRHYDELDRQTKVDFLKDGKKVESSLAYRKEVGLYRQQFIDRFNLLKSNLENSNAAGRVDVRAVDGQAMISISTTGFSSVSLGSIALTVERCGGPFKLYADENGNGRVDAPDRPMGELTCINNKYARDDLRFTVFSKKDLSDPAYLVPGYNQASLIITADRSADIKLFKADTLTLEMKNGVTGQDVPQMSVRFTTDDFSFDFDALNRTPAQFVAANPQFRLSGSDVMLGSGRHVFDRDVIVPSGTRLVVEPGASLQLGAGVSIYSKSPVTMRGTVQSPIRVSGSGGAVWGSFAIIDVNATSTIEYTQFDGGSEDYLFGNYVSGMVSIYHSPALIRYNIFSNSKSDDGLNVKYGYAEIFKNKFITNSADALDLDVTNSKVVGNEFLKNGNDGIDISSLRPYIAENVIRGSGDKCISVGENSQAVIFNNILDGCNFGFAAKDYSSPLVIHNTIINNNFGFGAYLKKQIFGGAHPIIINSILWGNKQLSEIDEKSKVDILFSDVQGGWPGEGNRNSEPKLTNGFVDVTSDLAAAGSAEKLRSLIGIELDKAPMGAIPQLFK